MQLVTISPVRTPLNLRPGVNEYTQGYPQFLQALAQHLTTANVQHMENGPAYQTLDDDDRNTLRLFTLHQDYPEYNAQMEVQVYSNTLSIFVVCIDGLSGSAAELEQTSQIISKNIIKSFFHTTLEPILNSLVCTVKPGFLESPDSFTGFGHMNYERHAEFTGQPLWTARAMLFDRSECSSKSELIRDWLRDTPDPSIAEDIITGKQEHSLQWLNYIIVSDPLAKAMQKIDTMCLAQYFYAVQDVCNSNLYAAISETYLHKRTKEAEAILIGVKTITRMHVSSFKEARKYFKRDRKELLDKILGGWEFNQLVENSERLIDICSDQLNQIHSSRSERSSFYTDLILVAIGFISLFDLTLGLSEYSRTYTSSAALALRDDQPSLFLSYLANTETDSLLLISLIAIISLFLVYTHVKRR